MLLPRAFIQARFHQLCTLSVLLSAQKNRALALFLSTNSEDNQLSHQQKIAQYYSRYLSKDVQPFFHKANDCLHSLSDTHKGLGYKARLSGRLGLNWLRSFVPATDEWKLRKEFSVLVDDFEQALLKELLASKKTVLQAYSSIKNANIKYLHARYFVSWKKKLLMYSLVLIFSTCFLFAITTLANFIILFGILALLALREILDPGFYIKCFGHKQVIEFSYGFDWLELEEEYFAKSCQFDGKFTLFLKALLTFRLLPELILRLTEFSLCKFIDFIDSFFIITERSSLVARGCKWSIHILFCLLMTPLQLLRPIENLLHWGLNTIFSLTQTLKYTQIFQFTSIASFFKLLCSN